MNIANFTCATRLWQRHETLSKIGATPNGGVDRAALTVNDFLAQKQLCEWGESIGMTASRDRVGNLFLTLKGLDSQRAAVMSGSHLDSQPTGGKYDGVYGVLAALESCHAMVEAGFTPLSDIVVVAWMNEEGSRFAPGMMGSAYFSGQRPLEQILPVQDQRGVTVERALQHSHEYLSHISIAEPPVPAYYLEAHIEQGPELEKTHIPIGVVTGIQGKKTYRITIEGEAAHAGTSPKRERKDAVLAAVRMIADMDREFTDEHDLVKFTVGALDVTPNAPSVVPERVVFSIDLRHPDNAVLRRFGDRVEAICQSVSKPCSVQVEALSSAMSLTFSASMQKAITTVSEKLGIKTLPLLSAAGHDARYLHRICPSAMLFIPCHKGITHNEKERIAIDDAHDGAKVLVNVLAELACQRD